MEYADVDIRQQSSGTKCLVNSAVVSVGPSQESIQLQLDQIVKGLAHVAEIVSNPSAEKNKQSWSTKKISCYFHGSDTHDVTSCQGFKNLSVKDRFELAQLNGGCFSCLHTGHKSKDCHDRKQCGIVGSRSNIACTGSHHPLLHVDRGGTVTVIANPRNSDILLMLARVLAKGIPLNVLYDPCATISLITKHAARQLRLTGESVSLSITGVRNITSIEESMEYTLPLTCLDGQTSEITVCEIEEITTSADKVDTNVLHSLFPSVSKELLSRPSGAVDILIGVDACSLLPSKVDAAGNLQLMKGPLGFCVRGFHEKVKLTAIRTGNVNITSGHVFLTRAVKHKNQDLKEAMDQFYSLEGLGVECSPKCGSCKCGNCSLGSKNFTIQEEKELEQIEKGLSYDETKCVFTATYPNIKSYNDLPNNFPLAKRICESQEKRLLRKGSEHAQAYQAEFDDMIKRGTLKLMGKEDLLYNGPIHYLPHFEVMKESSKSTKLRIVFNASSSYMGHRLNDYWAKGPSMLNDMLCVLLSFRQDYIAAVGDLKKMYNSVLLSLPDQQLHRIL